MTAGPRSVEVTRRVDAPPQRVFPYFTDPALIVQWQGSHVETEPEPGGRFQISFTEAVRIVGKYVEVDPPNRLVLTWGWEGATDPRLIEIGPGASIVEVTLEPDGDGTLVRVRHGSLRSERAREIHILGWTTYLGRLGQIVAGSAPGPDPFLQLAARIRSDDP